MVITENTIIRGITFITRNIQISNTASLIITIINYIYVTVKSAFNTYGLKHVKNKIIINLLGALKNIYSIIYFLQRVILMETNKIIYITYTKYRLYGRR